MKKPTRKARPVSTVKGLTCPACRGFRLFVVTSCNTAPGIVRRYRECSGCGGRFATEERILPPRPAKKRASR
jgi:transcriptional regulator NrdR family protein